jgi:hypothetical protein
MNQQHAQKLLELSQDPDILIHFSSIYVDGSATVYKDEETGEIVFDSRVFESAALREWNADRVTVSKVIRDWME